MLKPKKLNLNTLVWIFFYSLIFIVAIHINFSQIDADLPWHLRIGAQINQEQAAPTLDYYNYTLNNQYWIDHEWLFNFFFYYIFHHWGYAWLVILFSLLLTLTFLALHIFINNFFINPYQLKINNKKTLNFSIIIFWLYSLIALIPLMGVRMQFGGYFLILLLLIILENFSQTKQKKIFLILPLFFVFWANLHGSFLIGLFILWSWLIFKTLEPWFNKTLLKHILNFSFLSRSQLLFVYIISIISTLATLITPYTYKLYKLLLSYTNTNYLHKIAEWLPFYNIPIMYHALIITAIFCAIIILIFYNLSFIKNIDNGWTKYVQKFNPYFLFLSLLFLILSLKSKRHFPLFLFTALPLIIQFFYFEINLKIKKFTSQITTTIKIIFIFLVLVTNIYLLINTNINNDPFQKNAHYPWPISLVGFLNNHSELNNKKILTPYSWGGYWLWVNPQQKIFIDGRMPQIPYKNHTLLEEYSEFFDSDKLAKKLKDYNIQLVVCQKENNINMNKWEQAFLGLNKETLQAKNNALQIFLQTSPVWSRIYTDNLGEVYLLKEK